MGKKKAKAEISGEEVGQKGDGTAGLSSGDAEDGTKITYVIPCESCNAFLSLTKATDLDQICQACKTPVTRLVALILEDKFAELPLPPVSGGTLVTAVCTGEECGRTAQFPKGYAIYCPVCLKNVMKEKQEVPKSCCEHYFGDRGKRCGEKLDKFGEYLGNKPNPIFQAIYLMIMCSWFYMYYKYGWGEESAAILPMADLVPGGINLHMRIMETGFIVGVFLLIQCYRVDPGKVTPENHQQLMDMYKHPDVAMGEVPLKWCNTCRFLRPPRTHHCRMCDICVIRFDHHCVWLNTCIGAKNLRWFLSFVAWHAALCIYGVIFVFCLLRVIAYKLHKEDPVVLEWLGQRRFHAYMRFIPHTWGAVGSFIGNVGSTKIPWAVVWATNVPLMVLLIFCAVMGAVLASFFAVHVMQVLRNQTSYEGWSYSPTVPPTALEEPEAVGNAAAESSGEAKNNDGHGHGRGNVDESVEAKDEKHAHGHDADGNCVDDGHGHGHSHGHGLGHGKKEEEKADDVEVEDEPDRGSTCRTARKPPKAEERADGSAVIPAGEWVSKHDTGSYMTNIKEVIWPPMSYFPKVAVATSAEAKKDH